MPRYSLGVASNTTATLNAVRWELRAGATRRVFVRELGVALGAATASILGLGRPAAVGVTPTSPKTFLAEDPADVAAAVASAIAWGTAPTLPSADPLRRIGLPATIGAGMIWQFGESGLVIPAGGSLILYNLAASAAALDIYAVVDE